MFFIKQSFHQCTAVQWFWNSSLSTSKIKSKGGLISECTYFHFDPTLTKPCQITTYHQLFNLTLAKVKKFRIHKDLNTFLRIGLKENTFWDEATFSKLYAIWMIVLCTYLYYLYLKYVSLYRIRNSCEIHAIFSIFLLAKMCKFKMLMSNQKYVSIHTFYEQNCTYVRT